MPFYYMPAQEKYCGALPLRTGTIAVAGLHIGCAIFVYITIITGVMNESDLCYLDWNLNETANLAKSNFGVRCGYYYKCCGTLGNNYHCPDGPHNDTDSHYVYTCCFIKEYYRYNKGGQGRYKDIWDDEENIYEPMKTLGYRSLQWVKHVYLLFHGLKFIIAVICLVYILGEKERATFYFDSWMYLMILDCIRCIVLIILFSQIVGNEMMEVGWPSPSADGTPHKLVCHNCDLLIQIAENLLITNVVEFLICNIYFIFTINSFNIEMD